MQIPNINQTDESRTLVRLMALGLRDYCERRGRIPKTYEEFEATVVQESRTNGLEGGICFVSPTSQRMFCELMGLPPFLLDPTKMIENASKISSDSFLMERLRLANLIGTSPGITGSERADGIEQLGGGFKPVADSFRMGFCQRKAVFDCMREMIREGENQLQIWEDDGGRSY